MGVGLLCAVATLIAWITTRRIDDPGAIAHAKRRRLVVRLARGTAIVVLILVVGLPWMLSFLVTKAGTRPDERNRQDTPATYGATYEDVQFPSVDGNTLSGWYLASRGTGITIVMTHGLFRSRYELVKRGCDLWQRGYGVLLYDLRRHGQSKAEFSSIGYAERHDVEGALAYVRTRAPGDRIVLFGVSMGAAATLLAAAETNGVAAVVADSSFLTWSHTVYHHLALGHIPIYPFAPMLVWMTSTRMNYLPSSFDVLGAVKQLDCPILFIGGSADVRMPVDSVLDPLYDAARSPLKRRFVVEGSTHGRAYEDDPNGYIAAVTDFLQAAVPSSSPN
jgi:pimeloyl-ACP methyl ester carboxylesterase